MSRKNVFIKFSRGCFLTPCLSTRLLTHTE
jgi:hypothetical protein